MSGLTGSPLLRPAELLASLTETFTSGLSTVRSPSPLPDITTVATGRFHRRVFHPLDLQLASLHWFPALTGTMKALRLPTCASASTYLFRCRRPRDPPVFVFAVALLKGGGPLPARAVGSRLPVAPATSRGRQ